MALRVKTFILGREVGNLFEEREYVRKMEALQAAEQAHRKKELDAQQAQKRAEQSRIRSEQIKKRKEMEIQKEAHRRIEEQKKEAAIQSAMREILERETSAAAGGGK
jgi:hypothetical protein